MKVYKLRRSHQENAHRAKLSTAILKHNDTLHLLTRPGQYLTPDCHQHVTARLLLQLVGRDDRRDRRGDSAVSKSDSVRRTWAVQVKSSGLNMCS
jgi:hypothetical protein